MAQAIPPLVNWLGLSVTGDLGPLTIYTSRRRRIVMFDKAPPLVPQTIRQLIMRDRWRAAAQAWQAQTDEDREQWRRAARLANLSLPGYQIWIFANTKPNTRGMIRTIERQSGVTLPNKP